MTYRHFYRINIVLIALLSFVYGGAWAAPSQQQLGQADAARLPEFKAPGYSPIDPKITLPKAEPSKFAKTSHISLVLSKVTIEGANLFDANDLEEEIFKPSYEHKVSIADLQGMVDKITAKYRDAGYILSQAFLPEQEITKGVVHVRVSEGVVGGVEVEGDVDDKIRERVYENFEWLNNGHVTHIEDIETSLMLANSVPGIGVKIVVAPHYELQDAVKLVAIVTTDRYRGSVSLYNYLGNELGDMQQSMSGYVYNVMPFTTLGVTISSDIEFDKSRTMEVKSSTSLSANGLAMDISMVRGFTSPSFAPTTAGGASVSYSGSSSSGGIGLTYPIANNRRLKINLTSKVNVTDSHMEFNGNELYNDKIRTIELGFNSSREVPGQSKYGLGFRLYSGLDAFGASKSFSTRPGATAPFMRYNLNLDYQQSIANDFEFKTAINYQYAPKPLPASQEFGVGGQSCGRGYSSSALTGDEGYCADLEFSYRRAMWPFKNISDFRSFIFYDLGGVRNNDINGGELERADSVGCGIYMNFFDSFLLSLDYAKPLIALAGAAEKPDNRVLVSVTYNR